MAPLLSFRAGRAFRQGETNTVVPAPGRGLITIEEEDGLMHFYWKDLDANSIVEDLIIFPGDATFVKASERVHVLKFSSSSARSFFWHQDLDASHDQERADKVNELIGAQIDDEEGSNAATGGAMEVEPFPNRHYPTHNGSTSTCSLILISSSESPFKYQLQDVLTPSVLSSILSNPSPSLLEKLTPLLPPILPSNDPTSLRRATTGTPEFRRSVAALDRALRTGALGPLVRGLGMEEDAAMGVESFLKEVQRQAEEEKSKHKEEEEEEEMKEMKE
ncbi:BQ2448_7814 [Microbotryum intermedium]|uniref:BQ2448_7814 protein n=1 Tax=Microbotryum intermedium TaxID=269621 RepID=A0A238FNM9_9BASI|nr:BQ2448_7814 [Microbotryum intermedium]